MFYLKHAQSMLEDIKMKNDDLDDDNRDTNDDKLYNDPYQNPIYIADYELNNVINFLKGI